MKKLLVAIICFMFVGVASGYAEEVKKHTWELGTEISQITYEEPGVMEEEGVMWGVLGSYTYRDNWMLRGEGRLSYGQVDYDGKLSDGTPYTISGIDDCMFEFRGLAGYDFPVWTATILTPYTGFGYRYLNDDPSFDPAAYNRESNYYYSPIGIETITPLKNGWSVGAVLEYDYFWSGVQKSYLSDLHPSLNDVENDQNEGYGFRSSVRFQKESGDVDYVIEPFIRYWNIDQSEMSDVTYGGSYTGVLLYEPANESTEFGVKFAARF
ncbi:MAG: autotransporter outer membrane beta-barrel domain-containing protein [Candidatus Omnitrophica bacterium]|nr:autotransporter outer membrane beta-barrel domain-containing protein [Candidatus Omnitrophota bacterium]